MLSTLCHGQTHTLSGLSPQRFASTIEGKPTSLYILRNSKGIEACITNYGARLVSLMEPDRNGRLEDVVLGYDNITDYHTKGQNFGATVGRYIGRIIGPKFTIDSTTYTLQSLRRDQPLPLCIRTTLLPRVKMQARRLRSRQNLFLAVAEASHSLQPPEARMWMDCREPLMRFLKWLSNYEDTG